MVELSRTPVIVSAGMRSVIDEQLAGVGAQLRVEAEVDSVEAIRRLVIGGMGTTVMPISAFHAEIAAGSVVACTVEGANLHRLLVLARPVTKTPSAAIDEIEHIVRAGMTALHEEGLFRLPMPMSMARRVANPPRPRSATTVKLRRARRRRNASAEK